MLPFGEGGQQPPLPSHIYLPMCIFSHTPSRAILQDTHSFVHPPSTRLLVYMPTYSTLSLSRMYTYPLNIPSHICTPSTPRLKVPCDWSCIPTQHPFVYIYPPTQHPSLIHTLLSGALRLIMHTPSTPFCVYLPTHSTPLSYIPSFQVPCDWSCIAISQRLM